MISYRALRRTIWNFISKK